MSKTRVYWGRGHVNNFNTMLLQLLTGFMAIELQDRRYFCLQWWEKASERCRSFAWPGLAESLPVREVGVHVMGKQRARKRGETIIQRSFLCSISCFYFWGPFPQSRDPPLPGGVNVNSLSSPRHPLDMPSLLYLFNMRLHNSRAKSSQIRKTRKWHHGVTLCSSPSQAKSCSWASKNMQLKLHYWLFLKKHSPFAFCDTV